MKQHRKREKERKMNLKVDVDEENVILVGDREKDEKK